VEELEFVSVEGCFAAWRCGIVITVVSLPAGGGAGGKASSGKRPR
jgi:hypothetical protein